MGVDSDVAPLRGACCVRLCYTTAAHTYGALAVAYCCVAATRPLIWLG